MANSADKHKRLWRRPGGPLLLRTLVLATALGVSVWLVLDMVQSRYLQDSFKAEFEARLQQQAREDRLRFDQSIRAHSVLIRLMVEQSDTYQHVVQDHILAGEWSGPAPEQPPIKGVPEWMPPRSIMRLFPVPDVLVMIDRNGAVREAYQVTGQMIPEQLLNPSPRLLPMATQQAALSEFEGIPYVISAAPFRMPDGGIGGWMVGASRIDLGFLVHSQGIFLEPDHVIALTVGNPPAIAASSDDKNLPPGTLMSEVETKYLVTGKDFFDYGASDLRSSFTTLIPRAAMEARLAEILSQERQQRTILAAILVASFLGFLALVSRRLRALVNRVAAFSEQVFGVHQVQSRGDELTTLESHIERLNLEILSSREALEAEARERIRLVEDRGRIRAENERLHLLKAVADELGVGIITIDLSGPHAENGVMQKFADECGGFAPFINARTQGRDAIFPDQSGNIRTFDIRRPEGLGAGVLLVQDVTEQRRQENEIRDLALFPQQNPSPVLRIKGNGNVLHSNPASVALLRHMAEGGAGLSQQWIDRLDHILTTGTPQDIEVEVDGKTLSLTAVPVQQHNYVNIYGADITDRKRAEQALVRANQDLESRVAERTRELELRVREQAEIALALRDAKNAAEAANRAKTQFLANMSHELRTPLNAVIGFSEVMANEMLGPIGSEQYRAYSDDILSSGRHLLEVINDILDLSKIEAGHVALELSTVNVRDLVEATVRLAAGRVSEAKLAIETDCEEGLTEFVGDERRIKQMLLNLVSNSVKFTPEGGALGITARDAGDEVHLQVWDTGIGMTAEELVVALEPFGQVDSRLARRFEGTGLGLPLVKSFAEMHGGTMDIESAPDQGTKVTLKLPKSGPKLASAKAPALEASSAIH